MKFAQSCPTLCDPWTKWNSPGQNPGVGSLSLLQGTFPTQGSNPGLLHCWWILYWLSHKGSPRILEWVAYPFSSRYSWPKNQTRVSCIAGGLFTNCAIKKAGCKKKKKWCFQTVVLEKTLESSLDSKEIKLVNPKGTQLWIFIGSTDVEVEAPILWLPDANQSTHWKRPW